MAKRKRKKFAGKRNKQFVIKLNSWKQYTSLLKQLSEEASEQLKKYLWEGHTERETLDFAYALVTKYGEASSELACQMYDAIATYSDALKAEAEPAATATYREVARAIKGESIRTKDAAAISSTAGRLVKLAGVDTMMKNALRDGAQWAWIPSGDTCPFCLMLASRGWQNATEDAIEGGHATHIHNNCDCTYAVRFDNNVDVEGYDPDALYDEYMGAGSTQWERINALRREHYAASRDTINAQKRAAYARRIEIAKKIEKSSINDIMSNNKWSNNDIYKQTPNEIKKGLRKIQKRKSEHEEYIKNPARHIPEWDSFDQRYKDGLIKHWRKEIDTFDQDISRRIDELRRRGEYNGK